MRKQFSLVLAILLILSMMSAFTLTSTAADSIQVVPSSLTGLCSSYGQKSAAITSLTEVNGIPTVKIMPDRCVDRTADTENQKYPCYASEATVLIENSITSYNVDASVYKYARICYYYEPSDGDNTQYSPYLELELTKTSGSGTTFVKVSTTDYYVEGNWGYVTFDLSNLTLYEADSVIKRLRVYTFGSYLGVDKCFNYGATELTTLTGTLVPEDAAVHYAAIDFSTEALGTPSVSSVSFEQEEISIELGASASIPDITVNGSGSPITAVDLTLAGHTSANTVLVDDTIVIGADEESETITITATSVYDNSKTGTLTINVTQPLPRTEFDSDNVVLRFGVVSDVHQNGYYAGKITAQPFQEWAHTIDVFQKMAGTDEDGNTLLDAILVDGDMTDGVANGGSNVGSFSSYGVKALQNMREVGHFAKGLWGADNGVEFTETKKVVNESSTAADGYTEATSVNGLGVGVADGVKLFYSLGNHDESGRGFANFQASKLYTPVWAADLFAAVVCGWHYDPDSDEALANIEGGTGAYTDGYELSYRSYIENLIDYNTNESTEVTADSFASEYGVTLASADALFDKFYGHLAADTLINDPDIRDEASPSTVITQGSGLRIGNAHMIIDPDETNDTTDDAFHFIAIELGQNSDSLAWAKEIMDTSVEEDPSKPIFLITHYKVGGTMYASSSTEGALTKLLADYPQAIIWGGHTHSFMHNDDAIDSSKGFTSVETTTTRYAGSSSYLTRVSSHGTGTGYTTSAGKHYANGAVNYPNHEINKLSNGIYVEVDTNNSVRLHRVDIYRSYSAEYAKDTSLYSNFQEFATVSNNDDFPAVDEAVFIRYPWDITDIESGKNVGDYNTTARKAANAAPVFPDSSSISAVDNIGRIDVTATMNATDPDGMVYMYVAEIYETSDLSTCVERQYFTNFFYDYPQTDALYFDEYGITNTSGLEIDTTRTLDIAFDGLNPGTEYTVKFYAVDDYDVSGAELTATATTPDGTTELTLEDGRIAVFLDTTGTYSTTAYEYNGENYFAYNALSSALSAEPDVIFYISGDSALSDILSTKKDIEVIGLAENPEDAKFSYSGGIAFGAYNYIFKNLAFNKTVTGDAGLLITNNCNVTLEDVVACNNPLNVFTDNYGTKTNDGTLTVKGDTGPFNWICGIVYGGSPTTRDITLNLEGGTYNGILINDKNQSGKSITGDFIINISGGDYNSNVLIGNSKTNAIQYIGNTILNITGGDFADATVGVTGTTSVTGADITIIKKGIIDTIKTFNKSDNGIYITIPDNEGGIGDATKNDSGIITSFAVEQVDGKVSYVNGVAATNFTVYEENDNGENIITEKEYEISYLTASGIDFDLNGGEGTIPETITGEVGADVTDRLPDSTGFFRTNYDFVGWGTSADAVTPVEKAEITEGGAIYYAIWKAKAQYEITLDANGGVCEDTSVMIFENQEGELPVATKAGAVFFGWSENKDAKPADAVMTHLATKATTLYAIFAESETTVVYVDPTYTGSVTNGDYRTPYIDYATADKALTSGGIIVIRNDTSLANATTSTYEVTVTSLDPITGEDYAETNGAVYSMGSGFNNYRPMKYENITISFTAKNSHMNARGNKHIIGTGVKMDANSAQEKIHIRAGSFNVNHASTNIVILTPDVVGNLHAASGQTATVSGDCNIYVNGGNIASLNLGNDGGTSGTVGGNINVVIDAYSGTTLSPKFNKPTTVGGAVQFVFNNDSYFDNFSLNTSNGTITSGTYIVKSTADGYVETTSTAGSFKITTDCDLIFINGTEVVKAEDNIYALSGAEDGVYSITYENLYTVDGAIATVRDSDGTPLSGNYATITFTAEDSTEYTSEIESEATTGNQVSFEAELPAGTYTYKIEKNGYLTASGTISVVGDAENTLGTIELISGDIKGSLEDKVGDGAVDIFDFLRIIKAFSSESQDVLNANDIDEDGFVTVVDLVQVKANFGKKSS